MLRRSIKNGNLKLIFLSRCNKIITKKFLYEIKNEKITIYKNMVYGIKIALNHQRNAMRILMEGNKTKRNINNLVP